jgi:hypothetical protein
MSIVNIIQRHQRLRSTNHPSRHNNHGNASQRLSLDEQRRAGHLLGLVETHDCKDSGGDVAEHAFGLLERVAFRRVGHDEGDLVEGVGGLWGFGFVEHLLGVSGNMLVCLIISCEGHEM